tara:strand:+ start:1085 stop:1381 length:297 start_codon:yes stop_codon:yes gene_type:complete
MIKCNLVQVLTDQTKHKAQKREFRLLAELLAQQFHVRQGSHLVGLLGNGDERSNVEAIAYWLAEKGEYIDELKALKIDPLNHLHNELGKKLTNAEYGV